MCDKYQNYINIQSVDNTWLGSNYTLSVKNVNNFLQITIDLINPIKVGPSDPQLCVIGLSTKVIRHVSGAKLHYSEAQITSLQI